ncbi:MAG: hypothetical protein JST39_08050 [Bacteroidetes bacterium]|nr:hypothetical protein [Bacteroidota bacterium]
MSSQDNIWRRLQEYDLPPPAEAYDRLQQRLELKRPADDADSIWEQLRMHEVTPPDGAGPAIERTVFLLQQPARKRIAWNRYIMYSAAACLLLAVSVWVLRHNTPDNRKRVSQDRTVQNPIDSAALTRTSTPPVNPPQALPDTMKGPAAAINRRPVPSPRIEGRHFILIDNDLMATFSDFRYEEIPPFLLRNEEDRAVKVHLDQYTDLVISPPMTGMLKEMYKLKPNGDPTRKARRERRRLERWKKTDLEYFDGTRHINNPLDPIDLGRFIFK